jgi:glycosyltransferase involved in cell wall biosynthesis
MIKLVKLSPDASVSMTGGFPLANLKVLTLIPAWNEVDFIAPIVSATVPNYPLLVVDDGSSDATAQVAAELGAAVVSHKKNMGKGIALLTGFKWAIDNGYDLVVTLDADGQHDPREIPKFIDQYELHGADLIIGRRDFRRMPFPNNFANRIGTFLLSLALRQRILDNQSGFRLHTRRLLESRDLKATGFELLLVKLVMAVCKGFQLDWVDIRTIYGTGKKSYFHPWHDSLRFLKMVGFAYRMRRKSTVMKRA